MLDKLNELYKAMLDKFEGGLSNTSTKKFDDIVSSVAKLLDIEEVEVYATGSGSRPGNLEVRLSQGVRATIHTTVGLGFIKDDKNSQQNVDKLTNSALTTCEKFLGRGKAHYDNIVIFVESENTVKATGIIFSDRTEVTNKLIQEFEIQTIKEVQPTTSSESFDDDKIYSKEELREEYKRLIDTEGTAGNAIFVAIYGKSIVPNIKASTFITFVQEKYPDVGRQQELNQAYRMYEYFEKHPEMFHLRGLGKDAENQDVNITQSYIKYLTAIRTKPFLLLAGISGTGKSRIVRKLAQATVTEELQKKYDKEYKGTNFKNDRWNLHAPANFELIQVKPNWHNSMDVVGYLSNIPSPHYVFTPFVEFVARAWQHPEIPFFLCLDEMNLAPVEEYFAEFLSAIESRSFENNMYLTDPIIKPFKGFGIVNDEKGQAISIGDLMINTLFPEFKASEVDTPLGHIVSHFKNKGLTLPKNLIVIGTVNMDETTFSFSRKVLDRAMSIEMNEVKYNMFLADTTDDGLKQVVKDFEDNKYGEGVTLNGYLVDRHIEAKEIFADGDEDAITVIDYLTRINNLLEGTPFKLGYRAANEALIYVKSAEEFKNGGTKSALDSFTLMKILSRMEGDESKLTVLEDEPRLKDAKLSADKVKENGKITLLSCLRQIIKEELTFDIEKEVPVTPEDNNEEMEQESLVNEEETTATEDKVIKKKIPVEPQSVKKLDNMIAQLRRDHFVSYWN